MVNALRWLNPGFWGISVALSWMWGLGLFFSVQFTFQFGMFGLLTFAIPNALGLFLFGAGTHYIAQRLKNKMTLEAYFHKWARPFRLVFFLYQLLAITLTTFAVLRYLFEALELSNPELVLPLSVLIVLSAAFLFGEEFNMSRIKYSHSIMFGLLLFCIGYLCVGLQPFSSEIPTFENLPTNNAGYWGYIIPICVGFLVGPWLDLQQWQRAIEMQREKTSILAGYFVGSILFFLLLVFHGNLALWALGNGADRFVETGRDGIEYAHEMITKLLALPQYTESSWIPMAYFTFLGICILTTLDSGYLSIKWFMTNNVKNSKHALFALIPNQLFTSPIPCFIFAGLFSLFATLVDLELEYFMVFYATFFVGYAALAITRSFYNDPSSSLPQIKMFATGSLAVVIFAFGYFQKEPLLLIAGSLLPLLYISWLMLKPEDSSAKSQGTDDILEEPELHSIRVETDPNLVEKAARSLAKVTGAGASEYVQDKWYVHTFKATYGDTNSVGNVYFGMYAMWVGKTRELFFNHCLPHFNLKKTPYFILTRSFEHKFIREAKEFDSVSVKVRVQGFNRKFVTLEHQIFDGHDNLLGKGTQSLLFVSSDSYKPLDIPDEVHAGFLPFTT